MWGTTRLGGSASLGTIFKINRTTGALTTVKEFTDVGSLRGSNLFSGLTPDGAGNLWGTTRAGGNGNVGTIYKLNPTTEVLTTMAELGASSGQGRAVAVQPDGKTVVAGFVHNGANNDFAVVRYLADGAVDTAFGKGGTAVADFGYDDSGMSVALQSDGKIVVAGEAGNGANQDFGVARFNADGTLDTTFDTDGKATLGFNIGGQMHDRVTTVLVQPDGNILCVGYAYSGSNVSTVALARFTSTGSPDNSFDADGKLTTAIGSVDDGANGAVLQPDGKIVVGGATKNASGNFDVFLFRYTSVGGPDGTFGTSGKITLGIGTGSDEIITGLALQPDGKIVAGTQYRSASTSDYEWLLLRFNPSGTNDNTFDGDGTKSYSFSTSDDILRAVRVQPDGKIVAVGSMRNGTIDDMAVLRVNPDGSPDGTFDGDGMVTLAPGSLTDRLYGVTLAADGDIVAAGFTETAAGVPQFAAVRLIGGPNDLLVNGGFEANEALGGGGPTGFGDWRQDQATTVGVDQLITPYEGVRMARFLGTEANGASSEPDSELRQFVDLSAYATQIATGTASVTVTSWVNRVAASTDTEFALYLIARSGSPTSFTNLGDKQVTLLSDALPGTWQLLSNTFTLPAGTTHLFVDVYANENMSPQTTGTEFEGHYVDAVTLTVTAPPLSTTFADAATVGLTYANPVLTGWSLGTVTLGYAPTPGTSLMLVKNTGLNFIQGQFTNLAQGQTVPLTYSGVTYNFVANYYGGTGNDLVLQWANVRPMAWGNDEWGQLGTGSGGTSYNYPISVNTVGALAGKTVTAVSAGAYHSLALCSDGTMAAWGLNGVGQLGNNTTVNSILPVVVNAGGVLAGKTVTALATGAFHSLALCSDGTVAAWGNNAQGQLGNGSGGFSSIPVEVDVSGVLLGKTVVAVSAGFSHSVALCSDGTAAAWGNNPYGQLGNNSTLNSSVPVAVNKVGALAGKTVTAVSAGAYHSFALCSDGTVVAWGRNSEGQLGNNSTLNGSVPVAVSTGGVLAGKTVTDVSAGAYHSIALCSDGTVAAWGQSAQGQLGNSGLPSSTVPVAVNTSGLLAGKTVIALSAGDLHNLAFCSDGTVAAWGYNARGQLGNISTTNSSFPVAVDTSPLATGERFQSVGSGSSAQHNLALVASPPAPTVTTLASGSIGVTSATLNGTVNANTGSAVVSFEYGLTTTYGSNATATPSPVTGSTANPVSVPLTGLVPVTTYHYRVRATSAGGTTLGDDMTFTTLGYPDIALFAGGDDTAPAITDGQLAEIDFGSTGVGGAGATRTFTLKNTGELPLLLDGTFTPPAGWSAVDYDSAPLAPGATRTLTLRFLPTTTGVASGLITLNSNDPDAESAFTFPVTGTGLDVTAPVLTEVSIFSNNPNPFYATSGNTVSVSFTTNEPVQTPAVQIAQANGITITGGPTAWVASGTIDTLGAAPPEGPLVFHITPTDLAGNVGAEVSTVTDSSEITVDRTAPAFPAVSDVLAQETMGMGGATVTFSVSAPATDENGVTGTVYSPPSGSFFPVGPNLVNVTAYDPAGNAGTTQFFVNVNGAPVAVADIIHAPALGAGAVSISPLVNDTDAFGGTLTLVSISGSDYANVTVVGNDLVYERNTTGDGNDTLTYTISDGMGGTAIGTITLVNTAPSTIDRTYSAAEDTAGTVDFNYTDADNDPLTFTVVTPPTHGTVAVSNQFFTYTPDENYHGPDSFTFKATDDRGAVSNISTVSVEIVSINDAPVVTNQTATTNEDTLVNIPLNGTDVENHTLAYMIQRQPAHGTVSIVGGVATYTPEANYSGLDDFAFSADDGQEQNHSSQPADVSITVLPISDDQEIVLEDNTATPVLTGESLSLGEQDVSADEKLVTVTIRNTGTDTLENISAQVLDNFGNPSIGPFTLHTAPPASIPAGGSATLILAFDPIMIPNPPSGFSNLTGTLVVTSNDLDEVNYSVNLSGTGLHPRLEISPMGALDFGRVSLGTSATQTVRVRNLGPGVLTGSVQFAEGQGFSNSGTPTFSLNSTEFVDYVVTFAPTMPGEAFSTFGVETNDSPFLGTWINLTGRGNNTPLASGGMGSALEDQTLPSMVSLAGSDADATDILTLEIVTQPSGGLLSGLPGPGQSIFSAGTHTILYQPNANFSGMDSFTYRISDGLEWSEVATAIINVLPVNDAPVAEHQTVTISEDTAITFALSATDVDGDVLTAELLTSYAGPVVVVDGLNVTFMPEENVSGSFVYNYQVTDGQTTATATLTINVIPVNDAPETNFDVFSVNEEATLTVATIKRILKNDADVENDSFTAILEAAPPAAASFTLNPNGTFTYTPKPNFHGLDGFTYRAVDSHGSASEPETVLISVWATNDAPVAANLALTTLEDVPLPVKLRSADPDLLITFDSSQWLGIPPPNNGPAPHDADPIYTIVTQPQHGTLSGTAPNLAYTPHTNYHGTDSFTYTASDGLATSNLATVTITIDADSDGDTLGDGWEMQTFASLQFNASDDPDRDGQDNAFELIAGNDANDANSCLCLDSAGPDGLTDGVFRLNRVQPGVLYKLDSSPDLQNWDTIRSKTYELIGPGAITDPRTDTVQRRFYRVSIESVPLE